MDEKEQCPTWVGFLLSALAELSKHPCMEMIATARDEVVALAQGIKQANHANIPNGQWIVEKVEQEVIVDTHKLNNRQLDKMWSTFLEMAYSAELLDRLQNLAVSVSCTLINKELISWLLIDGLVKLLLKQRRCELWTGLSCAKDPDISDLEANVVRYVAGFLVRKLAKWLRNEETLILDDLRDDKEEVEDPALDKFQDPTESSSTADTGSKFMQYTKALDRGGLICVSDRFFDTTLAMERVAKIIMQTPCKDMAEKMKEAILAAPEVCAHWDRTVTVEDLTEEKKLNVLTILAVNYAAIRVKSFADAQKFLLGKKDQAFSRKSLRHNLDQ